VAILFKQGAPRFPLTLVILLCSFSVIGLLPLEMQYWRTNDILCLCVVSPFLKQVQINVSIVQKIKDHPGFMIIYVWY